MTELYGETWYDDLQEIEIAAAVADDDPKVDGPGRTAAEAVRGRLAAVAGEGSGQLVEAVRRRPAAGAPSL